MGGMLQGFVGGLAGGITQNLERQHDEEEQARRDKRQYLLSVLQSNLPDSIREDAFNELNKLYHPQARKSLGQASPLLQAMGGLARRLFQRGPDGVAQQRARLGAPAELPPDLASARTPGFVPGPLAPLPPDGALLATANASTPVSPPAQNRPVPADRPGTLTPALEQRFRFTPTLPPAPAPPAPLAPSTPAPLPPAAPSNPFAAQRAQMAQEKEREALEAEQALYELRRRQGVQAGLKDRDLMEYSLTGKLSAPPKPATLHEENYQLADGTVETYFRNRATNEIFDVENNPAQIPEGAKLVRTGAPAKPQAPKRVGIYSTPEGLLEVFRNEKGETVDVNGHPLELPAGALPLPPGQFGALVEAEALAKDESASPEVRDAARKQVEAAQAKLDRAEQNAKKRPVGAPTPAQQTRSDEAAEDPAYDTQAWTYIVSGKLPAVRGRGADAQARIDRVVQRAEDLMKRYGITAADRPALQAQQTANTSALTQLTRYGASIESFENTLRNNAGIARKLDEAYQRGDFPAANRLLGQLKTALGEPEPQNLDLQLRGMAQEWAKIMQGSTGAAGASVTESRELEQRISAAMSSGQLTSLIENVILKDADSRKRGNDEAIQGVLGKLRSLIPASPPSRSGAPAKSPGAAAPARPGAPGTASLDDFYKQNPDLAPPRR